LRGVLEKLVVCSLVISGFTAGAQGQLKTAAAPAKTDDVVSKASEAIARGEIPMAKALLRRAVEAAPTNPDVHSLLGIVADRENDLPAAEKHFAAAVRLAPQHPETHNNYGALLVRLNRKSDAAREFQASLKINPDQLSANVNLAKIRFEEGDLSTARDLFEKAGAIRNDAEISKALLVVYLRLKDAERARQQYQRYAADRIDEKDGSKELAALLLENGLAGEAARELESALASDPSNVDLLTMSATAKLQQKDVAAAGRLLESAVAHGVEDARVYAALADVYQAGGYLENAIPAMRLATEKDPSSEHYRVKYGLLLIDSKAPAAAVIRLSDAVKQFPNSARMWLALGIAQIMDGKSNEAMISFEKSLRIDPRSVPSLAYLATVQLELGQNAEAAKTYQKAIGVEEGNAILHYLLADTMLKIPAADNAVIEKELRRAVEIDPNLAPAYLVLGKLLARQEKWEPAVAEFRKAASLDPDVAETYYQLGRSYARLRRKDESAAAFDKYKKLNDKQKTKGETDRKDLVRRLANVRF